MKLSTCIIAFMCICACFSQTINNDEKEAEQKLQALYMQYISTGKEYLIQKNLLEKMVEERDPDPFSDFTILKNLKQQLDDLVNLQQSYKTIFKSKNISTQKLESYFPTPVGYALGPPVLPVLEDKAIYMLFGNKKVPQKELLVKNETVQGILQEIFALTSETSLGAFQIPGNRQKIALTSKSNPSIVYVYFKEIKLSIREGAISDMRVRVTNFENTFDYYFENRVPIPLLNFNGYNGARTHDLKFRHTTSLDKDELVGDSLKEYRIKASDVLSYFSNPGNNYVPDDIEFCLPVDSTDEEGIERRPRIYNINQNNSLQNIMELRTYTDFLGLFNEAPNGLVQFEGKADFYLVPFQLFRAFPQTIFKKVSPYVQFARIDEDVRGLTLVPGDSVGYKKIKRPLEIMEKSYLDMGTLLDFYGFSISKHHPFSFNIFGSLRYQISSISQDDDNDINFKTLGLGLGVRLESRRLNNFGFVISPEFTYYNHLNRYDFIENPNNLWVFRNEAEIFYYPGTSKSQSIFLRLRTYMDRNDGEDSFFQLQFGYRFAIGLGEIRRQN